MVLTNLTKSLTHRFRKAQTNLDEADEQTPEDAKLDAPGSVVYIPAQSYSQA